MALFRALGVALMAVFALSALASTTASAAVVVLPEVEEKWTGESGKGTLETLKALASVVCQKDKSEGTFEAKKPLGLFHITLEGCKAGGLVACTGLGEAKEVLLELGTFHLVFDKLGKALSEAGVGILFLLEPIHFECGGKLFAITGQLLCLIKPVNTKAKHFETTCERAKEVGDPGEIIYWNEKGEEVKMGENLLLTSENGGAGQMTSNLTTALLLATKEVELMT